MKRVYPFTKTSLTLKYVISFIIYQSQYNKKLMLYLNLVFGFDPTLVMDFLNQVSPTTPPFRAIRAITCLRNILTGDSHSLLGSEIREVLEELLGEGAFRGAWGSIHRNAKTRYGGGQG